MTISERNDFMNTKMNSMRKLAAVMAVVSSVTSLTACGAAKYRRGRQLHKGSEQCAVQ